MSGKQWNSEQTRIIRGMRTLRDRCPEHDDALPVWYSVVEMTVYHRWIGCFADPMRTEVARYDCGCMVTVDADTIGAPAVREVIRDA